MCLEAVPPNSVSRDPVLRKKMKHATALKSTNSTFRLKIGYARTTSLKSTGVISVRTLLCFFVVLLIFLYLTYFIFTILPLGPRYLEALAISDCFPLRISRIYLYWRQCCTPVISNNFLVALFKIARFYYRPGCRSYASEKLAFFRLNVCLNYVTK